MTASSWKNKAIARPISLLLADRLLPFGVLVVFALALLLGGGAAQGFWSEAIVELASLPLLLAGLLKLFAGPIPEARWPLALLGAIVLLPLVQLLPMPPSFWLRLPGRSEIAQGYAAAGVPLPWLPLSLDAAATWRSLLSLLPAVAIFLGVLGLSARARRTLPLLLLGGVLASVVVDLLQVEGGQNSPLYFYAITNPGRAVGFFANSNHNAALLYCSIPFAAAWCVGFARKRQPASAIGLSLLTLTFIGAVIGLALTKSRAGLALGGIAGLVSIALVWHWPGVPRRRVILLAVGANLLALLVAFQFGFVGLSERVGQQDVIEDLRWPVAAVTTHAAESYFPAGTGFGTFVPIYDMFAPRTLLGESYVNHAHDDWLELWLDGGLMAVLLGTAFLAWFAKTAFRVWTSGDVAAGSNIDTGLARAGSIAIILILLHSTVDYPLRTVAIMVVFALSCALMINRRPDEPSGRSRRRDGKAAVRGA